MIIAGKNDLSLACLIERGGVYHYLKGANPPDIIAELIELLPALPEFDSNALLQAVLEREALMSTGVGRGIAVPHPRNPVLGDGALPFVALGFPAAPINWNTPDGSMVHSVFLVVSVSAKQHLSALSKINFLCQQEKIHSLIKAQASKDEVVAAIRKTENSWIEK